jgi:uncharacterized membrane protein SpoIIM required for sporulation
MRETKFIEQKQKKWAEHEQLLASGRADPEHLNELFVQITDDLSYARTFYPNRSVRVYLNHLAQRVFHNVYKGRRLPVERLWLFWTDELPRVVWESRRALQLALALFVLAFGIGVLSSIINPDFARTILGDQYVEMTLSNIENGDPMAVYKDSGPLGMTASIALNNLYVALRTALLGVLASIGTAFLLLYNGVMVGAFQYFFIERGLFWESFLTIWIHGTLEISAIIIAGGAGLVAGSGLLFPGTYTRTQAFQITLRRGLKIFLGVAPIIVLAAIFEGFLTRFTETPDAVRGLFIAVSLAFVLWYFVWLPWHKARNGQFETTEELDHDLPPDREQAIDFNAVKTSGEVVSDVFTVVRRNLRMTLVGVFGSAAVFTAISLGGSELPVRETFTFPDEWLGVLDGAQNFLGAGWLTRLRWVYVGLLTVLAVAGYRALEQEWPADERPVFSWGQLARALWLPLPILLVLAIFKIKTGFWLWTMAVFCYPTLAVWGAAIWFNTANPVLALARSLEGIRFWSMALFGIFVAFLSLLQFWFLDSELWTLAMGLFSWLVPSGPTSMQTFLVVSTTFAASALIHFAWLVLSLGGALIYFSNREIREANHLHSGIARIGTVRQIRGLAKE